MGRRPARDHRHQGASKFPNFVGCRTHVGFYSSQTGKSWNSPEVSCSEFADANYAQIISIKRRRSRREVLWIYLGIQYTELVTASNRSFAEDILPKLATGRRQLPAETNALATLARRIELPRGRDRAGRSPQTSVSASRRVVTPQCRDTSLATAEVALRRRAREACPERTARTRARTWM
jgi:hypothetical protein